MHRQCTCYKYHVLVLLLVHIPRKLLLNYLILYLQKLEYHLFFALHIEQANVYLVDEHLNQLHYQLELDTLPYSIFSGLIILQVHLFSWTSFLYEFQLFGRLQLCLEKILRVKILNQSHILVELLDLDLLYHSRLLIYVFHLL